MVFFLKNYDAMKPAFSAVEPSMKFIIFNHFEGKYNNPFVFKEILNMG